MNLKLKALDPDNQVELTQLCKLYERCYGSQYSFANVTSENFWRARTGRRFSTLTVHRDGKIVSAVSLRPERESPKHVQLFLPVYDKEAIQSAEELRTILTDFIQRIAIRQGWENLFAYRFLAHKEQSDFSAFLLNGVDVAVWPCKEKNKSKSSKIASSIILCQKLLNIPNNKDAQNLVLFAPDRQLNFCNKTYRALGLDFVITDDPKYASKLIGKQSKSTERIPLGSDLLALSADSRAISRYIYSGAGFSLSFVEPSLLNSFKQLRDNLSRQAENADYVAINMLDPKAPQTAKELAATGFNFAGVLPYYRKKHYLLYFRDLGDLDSSLLESRSENLAELFTH